MASQTVPVSEKALDLLKNLSALTESYDPQMLDEMPDSAQDDLNWPKEIQRVVTGGVLMTTGKRKGASVTSVYELDKTYIHWVRSHINKNSGESLRRLQLYVEMRDSAKTHRLARELTESFQKNPAVPLIDNEKSEGTTTQVNNGKKKEAGTDIQVGAKGKKSTGKKREVDETAEWEEVPATSSTGTASSSSGLKGQIPALYNMNLTLDEVRFIQESRTHSLKETEGNDGL